MLSAPLSIPDAPLDVLVVSAHPDDAELSVGGFILKSLEEGLRVGILDLTSGEPTPNGTPEIRQQETAAATEVLGLTWRGNLNLPNRELEPTLEARKRLAEAFRLLRPRVLLTHYWEDAHPDHIAATQLTEAARFWSKLSRSDLRGEPFHPAQVLYYLSIHLRLHIKPNCVINISDHWTQKKEAIECYDSQLIQNRSTEFPTLIDDIEAFHRYWGWTIGKAYGEPLLSREEVGVQSIRSLLK